MAKYDRLFEHLCRAGDGTVQLTFDDLDRLVGGLPRSARERTAWWANEMSGTHPQAAAWINAGRQVVRVDRAGGIVEFSAPTWLRGA